jgi:hypothetical protein
MMNNLQANQAVSPQGMSAPVEQLCYTWSSVGYGSLSAGLRIRAVSPGLQVVNDDRVTSLDRYLRYALPPGADRSEIQKLLEQGREVAPVCLSLIHRVYIKREQVMEQGKREKIVERVIQERILVHKQYTGKDEVGRTGNFFIHALVGLPDDFSLAEAIALWRSRSWYTSADQFGGSKQLDPVVLDKLESHPAPDIMHAPGVDSVWMQRYLSRFIRAYLSWRKNWESWLHMRQAAPRQAQEPPRLYLAAPPDMIAASLDALTRCLPRQLLSDLTFSTYESDILSKDQVLLVGTSWIPDRDGRIDPKYDLPSECYSRNIAINCYNDRQSTLEHDELADCFAHDAASYLAGSREKPIEWFLWVIEDISDIDVQTFLKTYDKLVLNPSLTQSSIEARLESPKLAPEILEQEIARKFISDQASNDAEWCRSKLLPALTNLNKYRDQYPMLDRALRSYPERVIDMAMRAQEKGSRDHFWMMLSVLSAAAPAQKDPDAWVNLLDKLKQRTAPSLQFFSNNNQDLYYWLLSVWSSIPVNVQYMPPLLRVFWRDSERFFALPTPVKLEWKRLAFLADPVPSEPPDAKRSAISAIQNPKEPSRFEQFVCALESLVETEAGWRNMLEVFEQLARDGYPNKRRVLASLLKSPVINERERAVLNSAHMRREEREWYLQGFGPGYIMRQHPDIEAIVWNELATLEHSDISARKGMLYKWLQPSPKGNKSQLLTWLEEQPDNMERLLGGIRLVDDDRKTFLDDYGEYFFKRLAYQRWLAASPAARSGNIAEYIRSYVNNCTVEDLERSRLLLLLHKELSAYLPPDIQEGVKKLYSFEKFLAHPSPDKHALKDLGNSLRSVKESPALIERLAHAFVSCVQCETHLTLVIDMVSTFPLEHARYNLLQMLYCMAEEISNSLVSADEATREWAKDMLEAYTRFALCFEDVYPELSAEEHAHFLRTFLDLLLRTLHEGHFIMLESRMSHYIVRQDIMAKWESYISRRRPRELVGEEKITPKAKRERKKKKGGPELETYGSIPARGHSHVSQAVDPSSSPSAPDPYFVNRSADSALGKNAETRQSPGWLERQVDRLTNPLKRLRKKRVDQQSQDKQQSSGR